MTTATLATIEGRETALTAAVQSLFPQVDAVFMHHNGSDVDLGDAGKFDFHVEGYHIVCDDDLVYNPNYVGKLIRAVDKYDRKAVVSLHGRRMHRCPASYYRDKSAYARYHNQAPLERDYPVDIPGTGVMAYHTDAIRFTMEDFPQSHRNMADLHVAVKCALEGVPVYCIAHTGREVTLSPHVNHAKDTIHAWHYHDDALQTELVQRLWKIRQGAIAA